MNSIQESIEKVYIMYAKQQPFDNFDDCLDIVKKSLALRDILSLSKVNKRCNELFKSRDHQLQMTINFKDKVTDDNIHKLLAMKKMFPNCKFNVYVIDTLSIVNLEKLSFVASIDIVNPPTLSHFTNLVSLSLSYYTGDLSTVIYVKNIRLYKCSCDFSILGKCDKLSLNNCGQIDTLGLEKVDNLTLIDSTVILREMHNKSLVLLGVEYDMPFSEILVQNVGVFITDKSETI